MKWVKQGRIFNPDKVLPEGISASLMPISKVIDDDKGVIRIYFSPRDLKNRSEVHFFDFDLKNYKILKLSEKDLIKRGKLGAFDDSGITLGSIVEYKNQELLYYTGWNLTLNVPMNNSIGVAILEGNEFKRLGDGPVMTRTLKEPYSCASPFVMKDQGILKMWYASMDKWTDTDDGPLHHYNIKYAESNDGITWSRKGIISIDYEKVGEYAFGRPFVLKEHNIYKMWYSFRGVAYRIGYAESIDGIHWIRKDDEVGIDVSKTGWDSEMIEYPFIFDRKGDRYMLFNGNGYGKTGIGLAKLE